LVDVPICFADLQEGPRDVAVLSFQLFLLPEFWLFHPAVASILVGLDSTCPTPPARAARRGRAVVASTA